MHTVFERAGRLTNPGLTTAIDGVNLETKNMENVSAFRMHNVCV